MAAVLLGTATRPVVNRLYTKAGQGLARPVAHASAVVEYFRVDDIVQLVAAHGIDEVVHRPAFELGIRLFGVISDVGRQHDLVEGGERVAPGQGLGLEHIDSGTGDLGLRDRPH